MAITQREIQQRLDRAGTARTQRTAAINAVETYPGRTTAELAHLTGLDRRTLSKRLPELAGLGTIRRGGQKLCPIARVYALTWKPADA